jgi:D-amino-acid dehydrogenase
MNRRVVVVGAGVVGAMCALHALRDGHGVTIVEPADPGGEQASSSGNLGWLSTHSVLPTLQPGTWSRTRSPAAHAI